MLTFDAKVQPKYRGLEKQKSTQLEATNAHILCIDGADTAACLMVTAAVSEEAAEYQPFICILISERAEARTRRSD